MVEELSSRSKRTRDQRTGPEDGTKLEARPKIQGFEK
jgi:hypothetical protein